MKNNFMKYVSGTDVSLLRTKALDEDVYEYDMQKAERIYFDLEIEYLNRSESLDDFNPIHALKKTNSTLSSVINILSKILKK